MADDWRVSLDFGDERSASEHEEKLAATAVAEDVARKLGRRVAVSRDGSKLFLYADDEDAARTAYHVVRSDIAGDKLPAAVELSRWHDEAEDWEPADRPLPQTEEEHRAEHASLMEREDQETAERGYSEWEVRLDLPSRQTAHELSERLDTPPGKLAASQQAGESPAKLQNEIRRLDRCAEPRTRAVLRRCQPRQRGGSEP